MVSISLSMIVKNEEDALLEEGQDRRRLLRPSRLSSK